MANVPPSSPPNPADSAARAKTSPAAPQPQPQAQPTAAKQAAEPQDFSSVDNALRSLSTDKGSANDQRVIRALRELGVALVAGMPAGKDRDAILRKVVASKDAFVGPG